MNQRIAPSERIEQVMSAFLQEGITGNEQPSKSCHPGLFLQKL